MDIMTIVSLVMLGIGLLFVGLGILKNRKNHWIYAIARLAVVILSIVGGVLIAKAVGGALATGLLGLLVDAGVLEGVSELMDALPVLEEAICALVGCVFALILFVLIFVILKAILNGIAKPIARKIIAANDFEHTAAFELEEKKEEEAAPAAEAAEEASAEENAEAAADEAATDAPAAEEAAEEKPKLKGRAKRRFKKKSLRTPKANAFGMLGGAIGCLLVWVALFAPLVGVINMVDDGMSILDSMGDTNEDLEVVVELVDIAANNAGSKAITYLGGKPIFDGLTTCRVGGHNITLSREVAFLSVTGDALMEMSKENADKQIVADKLRGAKDAFQKTSLLPVLIPEVCHAAYDEWEKGNDFCGLEKPEVDGTVAVFFDPFLDVMAESDYDTVKEDVGTVLELIAEIVEADALARMEKDPILLFEDTEFCADMLKALLDNKRMNAMVGGFLQFGINSIGDVFNMYNDGEEIFNAWVEELEEATAEELAKDDWTRAALAEQYQAIFDDYGMTLADDAANTLAEAVAEQVFADGFKHGTMKKVLSNTKLTDAEGRALYISEKNIADETVMVLMNAIVLDSTKITNTKTEAQLLATVLAEMANMTTKLTDDDFEAADAIGIMGKAMDTLAMTETVGAEDVGNLVIALFQSREMNKSMSISIFDMTDIAKAIVEGAKTQSYVVLLTSVGDTVRVLEAVNSEHESLADVVKSLTKSLNAESAKVLQTMAKPSMMVANGVPEASADASASLMSNMFGNLAEMGADMSDEDFEREAQAITNMTNLAMNLETDPENGTFGENGALGTTAEDFVNDILDSSVMSLTLRQTVYAEEGADPVMNPLNSSLSMDEDESADFLDALNARWMNETDTENEETRQSYVALGAMMNMELVITDSGIVQA